MKKLILLTAFIFPLISFGAVLYCSPGGSDGNTGTIGAPFKTWAKLFSVLNAGDTGYVRGGTYTSPFAPGASDWLVTFANKSGTSANHIVISAYQNEQPVLDLNGFDQANNTTVIRINKCSFVDFIGLWVKNMKQHDNGNNTGSIIGGWEFHECTNIQVIKCWVHNIGGAGFRQGPPNGIDVILNDKFTYINCDASWCGDAISTGGGIYGNADGFDANQGIATYVNCRAWWNSDDGFDCFNNDALVTYAGCLSFWNGFVPGTFGDPGKQADGNGYKWGVTTSDLTTVHIRTYTNCVAFQNKAFGYTQNICRGIAWVYNNTSYQNNFQNSRNDGGAFATGWSLNPKVNNLFTNNLSYLDGGVIVSDVTGMTLVTNSWQVATPTNASFASLDTTGISGLRTNGALPVTAFLHLSVGSNQIDKGTNVGLPFSGSAPDLGAYEFVATNNPPSANAGIDQTITLPTSTVTLAGSAVDADGTITSHTWSFVSGPTTPTITTPGSYTSTVTGLTVAGTYQLRLSATDNGGATSNDVMQIIVNPAPNVPPVANAGTDKNITLPTSSVTQVGSGTDADGTISAYLWTKVSGPGSSTIVSPTQATTVINNLVAGTYIFNLRVTDNVGATASDQVTIIVNAANVPPTANAGTNQTITLPTNSVTLTGSGTDPDGTIASYSWTKISGPATFTIVSPTSATTVVNNLIAGTYVFQLVVTDNQGATGSATVQVLVNAAPPPNQPPVVNAGIDKNIALPTNSITQVGSATDPDGTVVSYAWTKISGPATFTIVTPTASSTVINNLVQGTYVFQLTATDNQGATGTDQMTVIVNPAPNIPPVTNAGPDQTITLPTTTTTLAGSATDQDGTITAHTWSFISGPATPTITTPTSYTSGVTGLTVAGSYILRLTATDNSTATTTDDMIILVNPAPNQLPVANAGTDKAITLPTNSVTQVGSGSDPDGTIVAYLWTRLSGPTTFTIVSASQATTVINNLVAGTYVFNLRVTDNSGANANDQVTIVVSPAVNQFPTANAGANQTITLPTNSVTLVGSGSDPDGTITAYAWTKISGPATFTIVSPTSATTAVNNLVAGTYVFQLQVTDNGGATATNTTQIIVNAAPPPNQPPIANAGTDKNITLPTNSVTQVGSGTDADGTVVGYAWTKISGPATFVIGSPSSSTTTISNLVQGTYVFQLTVADNQAATGTDQMTITVNPAPNIPPVANAGIDQTIQLPTSSATFAGSATDQDGTITSHTWSFVSGPATPAITTPSSYTSTVTGMTVAGSYTFRLTVTDNSSATATDNMIILVNPAPNILPIANAGPDQIDSFPSGNNGTGGLITLNGNGSSDPDGTITGYLWTQVSGPTSATITTATQVVTTVGNLVNGIYVFRLRVTDNRGGTATDEVNVHIVDVFIPVGPIANAGPDLHVIVCVFCSSTSVTAVGSGTSDVGTIVAYQWTKLSGPAQGSINSPNTAVTSFIGLVRGTYVFQLKVTDSAGLSATDTMTVDVRKNYILWRNGRIVIIPL
jgi:hypothetical protein